MYAVGILYTFRRLRNVQIAQNSVCTISARRSHDTASGVGPTGAHIKALHRTAVAGVAAHRPGKPKLMNAQRGVRDVTLVQSKYALQVQRSNYIAPNHRRGESGAKLVDNTEHTIRVCILKLLVRPAAMGRVNIVWRELHKELHHVVAWVLGAHQRLVHSAGDGHLDHGAAGGAAEDGLLVSVH